MTLASTGPEAIAMLRNIKGLLIDLSGTIHIGNQPLKGAVEAIKALRLSKIPFRFCSNTSKESAASLRTRLQSIGFDIAEDEMHTSLTATRAYIDKNNLRPLLLLSDSAKEDFEATDGQDKSLNAIAIGLYPSQLNYENLNKAFRLLVKGKTNDDKVHLIATHKAAYFREGDGELSLGPGGFVELLEQAGNVTAQVMGKPTRPFFEYSLTSMAGEGIAQQEWSNIAVIGDDTRNDLGDGAIDLNLRRILVKTGKFQEGDESKGLPPDAIFDSFAAFVDALLLARSDTG